MGDTAAGIRVAGAVEFAVKAIALGAPVLYVMGRLFSDGYWGQLGLPASLIAPGVEDCLYLGFLSVLLPLGRLLGVSPYGAMGYALLIALALALYVVAARLIGIRLKIWARKRVAAISARFASWSQERRFVAKELRLFVLMASFVSFLLVGGITVVLVLFVPLSLAVSEGKLQAREADASLRASKPAKAIAKADYRADGAARSAPLLECSGQWCIVFQDNGYVAIPASDVIRVRLAKPAEPIAAARAK